jgi:hypothetical protein
MKYLAIAVLGLFAIGASVEPADARKSWFIKHLKKNKTDFALFDGTNPANLEPGVLCYVNGLRPRPWQFHVAVTNNDPVNTQSFQVVYKDGDWVRYYVPPRTSFALTQAAGHSSAGVAIRVFTAASSQLSGAVSAQTFDGSRVTCKSCDNDGDGPAACDAIVPSP